MAMRRTTGRGLRIIIGPIGLTIREYAGRQHDPVGVDLASHRLGVRGGSTTTFFGRAG